MKKVGHWILVESVWEQTVFLIVYWSVHLLLFFCLGIYILVGGVIFVLSVGREWRWVEKGGIDLENKGGGKFESVCVWTERKSDLNKKTLYLFPHFFFAFSFLLSHHSCFLTSLSHISHSSIYISLFLLSSFLIPFLLSPCPSLLISFSLSGSIDRGQKHCLTFVEINNWNINTASLREKMEQAKGGWCESVKEKERELEWEAE